MKQSITINIGGAGIRIGHQFLKQIHQQHQTKSTNPSEQPKPLYNNHYMFHQTQQSRLLPRTLFLDTGPDQIDEVKRDKSSLIIANQSFVNGKEDSSNNSIRGAYTLGRNLMDESIQKFTKQLQKCSTLEGIIINLSFSGGTGSGFGTAFIERIKSIVQRKSIMINLLAPSPKYSDSIVQPYNVIYGLGSIRELEHKQKIINIFDNQKIYSLCQSKRNIEYPSYMEVNQYIASMICTITNPLRVEQSTHSFSEICTNLVPYKQMCYLDPTYVKNQRHEQQNTPNFCEGLISKHNSMSSYNLPNKKLSMGSTTFIRGCVNPIQIVEGLNIIRQQFKFPKWIPTGIKLIISNSKLGLNNTQACLLNNNLTMLSLLKNITKKYDRLHQKRSFVHWFVGEGIADEDFRCGRDYCQNILQHYQQFSIEQNDIQVD